MAKNCKKKILFYIDTLGKGGLDKVVLQVANNLDSSKYDITIQRRFPGGYYSQFVNENIKLKANMPFQETINKHYNHLVRVLCDKIPRKILYRLFIHKKYDIEIACDDAISARVIGGSPNKKSKKFLWEHMDVILNESTASNFSKEKVEWFFGPFDKIINVSQDCEKKFIEKYGFEEKCCYVYNPIDVDDIVEKANEYIVDDFSKDFNVLAIGRFMPQKAFLRLLDVTKTLVDEGLNFKLNIIGEGPEESLINEKIDQLQLNDCVRIYGFQDNPYPFIKCADLFVCSSIHESYCLVVAESLVIGTPVISTRCAGPIELLNNGEYGKLVDNSYDGLVDGLRSMITDREMLNHYKIKCADRKDFFDIHTCIKGLEKIFDEE